MNHIEDIETIIEHALKEDIRTGDVTSDWTIPEDLILNGTLIAKARGIIAGLDIFQKTLKMVDERLEIVMLKTDGQAVERGEIIANISGPGRGMMSGERVALNFLQRMSGIATCTNKLVNAISGTKAVILDTRKTVPGLRLLDKMAVQTGGGQNHRFGLYDMVLIKDNHISAAGSITRAVENVRAHNKDQLLIEVEVKNLSELDEAIELRVDRILLDNMSVAEMEKAVEMAGGKIPLEASGNITLDNVLEIAQTGVDFISSGMLTHSVTALDVSLLIRG